jgi:hypothetical protein
MGQADDGIHRRPDFVAHVGQKQALGGIGRIGLRPRFAQFAGAAGNQFLEVVAMRIEFAGDLLLFGDVFLDRHVVRYVAVRLADGRDNGELDELAAVLAPVVELAMPRTSVGQRIPERHIAFLRRPAGLQDAGVLADDFLAGVAGDPQEGLVDVFDVSLDVGDDDALRTLLDGQRQFAQLLLGTDALRDIAGQYDHGHAASEVDAVRTGFGDDFGSVLASVAPGPRALGGTRRPGNFRDQLRHFLRRADILDRHAQEFVTAIAVVGHRRIVDVKKGQRFPVINPHRVWVGLEHVAIARIALVPGLLFSLARRDVAVRPLPPGKGAGRVVDRARQVGDPARFPRGLDDPDLQIAVVRLFQGVEIGLKIRAVVRVDDR